MSDERFNTIFFEPEKLPENQVQTILLEVYAALQYKGYNPVDQMVGYLMSGDPTYITAYDNSRAKITRVTRDDILEELVKTFVDHYELVRKEKKED